MNTLKTTFGSRFCPSTCKTIYTFTHELRYLPSDHNVIFQDKVFKKNPVSLVELCIRALVIDHTLTLKRSQSTVPTGYDLWNYYEYTHESYWTSPPMYTHIRSTMCNTNIMVTLEALGTGQLTTIYLVSMSNMLLYNNIELGFFNGSIYYHIEKCSCFTGYYRLINFS